MTDLKDKNKTFFKIFEEVGIKRGTHRTKIQISKNISGVDTLEKNGFVFEKGELFQNNMMTFVLSTVKCYNFTESLEMKAYEAAQNGDFEIYLFKTPTGERSTLATVIIQNNMIFHFEAKGNRKTHNELIDFLRNEVVSIL